MISYTNCCRQLYTMGFYLVAPILVLRMWYRSLRHGTVYTKGWQERFGFTPILIPKEQKVIWIHAVSLGETIAATPLIKALLKSHPEYKIVITSTTPSGSAQVIKQFGNEVYGFYLPYDLPGSLRRFFNRIHPNLGIIMETELWPNLLAVCENKQIPLLLANARLSAKSAAGYQKIKSLTAAMLKTFSKVAAQSSSDAERFLALGLPQDRLDITGNIKFDIQIPADLMERGKKLHQEWGSRLVFTAASTHEGEESLLLNVLSQVKRAIPSVLFILVPRHPERFAKVGELCRQHGFSVAIRSKGDPVTLTTDILLGDTMGELLLFYAASDLAFVGGSWVPVGGHNLIEPAILHVPVITGPQLHNFVDVSRLLLAAGGAKVVENADAATETVIQLLKNTDQRLQMGENGFNAVMANTGALEKHLKWIDRLL